MTAAYRVAVDIGGTFTDFGLQDTSDRIVGVHKVLTTPRDPTQAVLEGTRDLLRQTGIETSQVAEFTHATTLVTNILIERTGPRVGLVTTAGFRDLLEMRSEARYDLYDLFLQFPDPLVSRPDRREVVERIDAAGRIVTPLDEVGLTEEVRQLVAGGVEALAICFLNSYANPIHERQARNLVRLLSPQLSVSLSSDVQPEIREYQRFSTAVANAYVQPRVQGYLSSLSERLAEIGYRGPIYIMLSNGGLTKADQAGHYPVRICESGPAAGVVGTSILSDRIGFADVVAFDMGGTTAKISVIKDGRPQIVPELEVARVHRFKRGSGIPIRIPSVELIEIGAGGGSIAWIDHTKLLEVGPQSAGAFPGPACYGRGGTAVTVTDANLVLGLIDPQNFLGGRMPLDIEAARAVLTPLARQMQLDLEQTAWAIYEIVTEKMAMAARMHIVERGFDPRRFTYVAFGGAGPLHACRLAEKLGADTVLIPAQAGVASALGLLMAPTAVDVSQSAPARLGSFTPEMVREVTGELERRADAVLGSAGNGSLARRWSVDARYEGQGFEVVVDLPDLPLTNGVPELIGGAFEAAYKRIYGRTFRDRSIQLVTWRLRLEGREARPALLAPPAQTAATQAPSRRTMWFDGGETPGQVLHRLALYPGQTVAGLATIHEPDSTTVVPPGWVARLRDDLNLLVEREAR